MRGANVQIVLQSRHFLIRSLELPAGAANFLDGVVRTQIDRLTPWRSTEAAFGTTAPERLEQMRQLMPHAICKIRELRNISRRNFKFMRVHYIKPISAPRNIAGKNSNFFNLYRRFF